MYALLLSACLAGHTHDADARAALALASARAKVAPACPCGPGCACPPGVCPDCVPRLPPIRRYPVQMAPLPSFRPAMPAPGFRLVQPARFFGAAPGGC